VDTLFLAIKGKLKSICILYIYAYITNEFLKLFYKENIHNRVKYLKTSIDSLYDKFLKDLEGIKGNTLNSLDLMGVQIKKRATEYINFANNMNENLNRQIIDGKS
jgi:hypothetical protein